MVVAEMAGEYCFSLSICTQLYEFNVTSEYHHEFHKQLICDKCRLMLSMEETYMFIVHFKQYEINWSLMDKRQAQLPNRGVC